MDGYRGMRVLVTGSDGFIGSHLARRLVKEGAIVSGTIGKKRNSWRLADIAGSMTLLEADLGDAEDVARVFSESAPQIVFNVASSLDTKRSLEDADEVIRNTYDIARLVMDAAHKSGVTRVVQFGSIEEYGFANAPMREDLREAPISPYSLGKVMGTQYALMLARLTPLEIVVVRPAATFGPGQGFTMLTPVFIRSALEGKDFAMNPGAQVRDFIYVEDLVEGVLRAGLQEGISGEIVNLGSDRGTKVRDLLETICREMGDPIAIDFGANEYRPLDTMEFYMDSSKAKRLLGWEATTPLSDAIQKTVAWYREHADEVR